MKKFILKTLWFVLPYTILFLLMIQLYPLHKGDLTRLGNIVDLFPSYNSTLKENFKIPIRHTKISEKPNKRKFKILTIGDSFSDQPPFDYKNQIAQTVEVLYIDRWISKENPIQDLYAMARGDFFDEYKIYYVVLQSVERSFTIRASNFDTSKQINVTDIFNKIETYKPTEKPPKYNFFSNQVSLFLYNTYQYITKDDYCFEDQVYKTKVDQNNLFSINTDNLLFYADDLNALKFNNDEQRVEQLNLY